VLRARVDRLGAELSKAWVAADALFLSIDDGLWTKLLDAPELAAVSEPLDERRRRAKQRLEPQVEALVRDVDVDGYHAWGQLYDFIAGSIRIPFEEDGKVVQLSAGQAQNKFFFDPDRSVRERVFRLYEDAWEANAELCARALNHLGGFRLALYRNRGWESVLFEPLENNRMEQATLDAMWAAVSEGKPLLKRYLERKARLLGIDALCYFDVNAPVGRVSSAWSYDYAANFIVTQLGRFSRKMADLARQAFERRWIEAEDRPGKRPGGFCAWLPATAESRIFLTFDNSIGTASTIAHELGHAYHHAALDGKPELRTRYPLNLAETASTLAELIVADAGMRAAQDADERLALLDAKVQDTVAFFMNIHARFLFEVEFYKERASGMVPAARLNELMLEAQQQGYGGALAVYHPYLWASKLHFYRTRSPFYNFPYTFGYLFSYGVLEWALEEKDDFDQRYQSLLEDTGYMRTEALARKHFGVDLTDVEFWRGAVKRALAAVEEFLRATE